jgi:uncharacterized BrkB/YihY/UPF0761 family membrane protein
VGFRWPVSTRMVVFGLWFYLSGAAVLIGAEVNEELLEAADKKLPVKEVLRGHLSTQLPLAG